MPLKYHRHCCTQTSLKFHLSSNGLCYLPKDHIELLNSMKINYLKKVNRKS